MKTCHTVVGVRLYDELRAVVCHTPTLRPIYIYLSVIPYA
nr:MAG TPA_asm: hypothetical protein [Caudoviricetes sp.]